MLSLLVLSLFVPLRRHRNAYATICALGRPCARRRVIVIGIRWFLKRHGCQADRHHEHQISTSVYSSSSLLTSRALTWWPLAIGGLLWLTFVRDVPCRMIEPFPWVGWFWKLFERANWSSKVTEFLTSTVRVARSPWLDEFVVLRFVIDWVRRPARFKLVVDWLRYSLKRCLLMESMNWFWSLIVSIPFNDLYASVSFSRALMCQSISMWIKDRNVFCRVSSFSFSNEITVSPNLSDCLVASIFASCEFTRAYSWERNDWKSKCSQS